jgi:hypothetical protein
MTAPSGLSVLTDHPLLVLGAVALLAFQLGWSLGFVRSERTCDGCCDGCDDRGQP